MYRLLNKITALHTHNYNHHLLRDYSYPTISKRETKLEEDIPNPVKSFEIFGFSVGGYGRGKKDNQDSFNILQGLTNDTHFFAVYDGHGINGKDVSQYVKEHVAEYMKKDVESVKRMARMNYMEPFLKHVFKSVDNSLNSSSINTLQSGTCCNGILVSKGKCYIANLGDSRAILCRQGSSGENVVMNLSQDHKPTRSDEQNRILQMGGRVGPMYYKGISIAPLRVWDQNGENGLAMTRTIGDINGKKAGIISEPEIKKIDLEAGDKFIIVASDGIWDVMTSQEAADFVLQYDRFGHLRSNIPMALACEARRRWESIASKQKYPYCDDISVIVAFPEFN